MKEIYYDKEKKFFLYLMTYVSRFFMNDEEIVIFDLFVYNECLYLEKDIINCINMNEQKIRNVLSKLLKEKFIIEVKKHKNNDKNANYQTFYCLNNYIVYVIDFRIKQMEIQIHKKKTETDIYICNFCNATYSQLDAQILPLDSYDAHFLCFCNNKIDLITKEDDSDDKIYYKYTKHLNVLKEHIEKLKNYFIPLYNDKFNKNILTNNYKNNYDNISEEDSMLTRNSSDVSYNNSGIGLNFFLEKNDKIDNNNKSELQNDNSSSVIRKNKKIKICMNTKNNIKKNKINNETEKSSSIIDKTKKNDLNENIDLNVSIKNKKKEKDDNKKQNTHKIQFTQDNENINEIIEENINKYTDDKNESNVKNNELYINTKNITDEQNIKNDSIKTPLFYIEKFNKQFTLTEAQKLQQDMSHEEFEKFVELQEIYLNDF